MRTNPIMKLLFHQHHQNHCYLSNFHQNLPLDKNHAHCAERNDYVHLWQNPLHIWRATNEIIRFMKKFMLKRISNVFVFYEEIILQSMFEMSKRQIHWLPQRCSSGQKSNSRNTIRFKQYGQNVAFEAYSFTGSNSSG